MCQPRFGVIYHTMISEDLRVPIIDDVRHFWKGPLALAEALCVFNISSESISLRRAIVPDLAWPVPAHNHGSVRPPMDHHDIKPMSDWLKKKEIPIEGVVTDLADT